MLRKSEVIIFYITINNQLHKIDYYLLFSMEIHNKFTINLKLYNNYKKNRLENSSLFRLYYPKKYFFITL